jgi:anti-anti-sigma factor
VGWDNSRILDAQIHKMVEKGCTFIVFNLDEVTFLCSGGIGALVYNMKKVQDQGGDVFVVSSSDYIQFLFATIGFNVIFKDRVFETFEDFSEKVLVPKGMSLSPLSTFSSVIRTDEASASGGMEKPSSAAA